MGIKRKVRKVLFKETAFLPDIIYVPQNDINMRVQYAVSFDCETLFSFIYSFHFCV